MSYLELQLNLLKQYLILLLETVKFWEKDLLADVEIEIESQLEYLEIKGCSVPFNFRKLLSREEKLSAIMLKVGDLLTLGFSSTFKSSVKLGEELFADKSCFQKWVAHFLLPLYFCEVTNLRLFYFFFLNKK